MAELINDVLRLAKLAETELKIERVQLSLIAQDVVRALRLNDPERRVEVNIDPEIEVQGDAGLLRAAIDNLLSNAWKYTAKVARPIIEFARCELKIRWCDHRESGFWFKSPPSGTPNRD